MFVYRQVHRHLNEKIEVCLTKADFSKGLGIVGERISALPCSYALRQTIWTKIIKQFGANADVR